MMEFLIFAETKHKLMDNIIFEKKEVREAWNQKVLDRIAEFEKNCTPFPIGCYQREGVWGIWFQSGDEFLLVNPIELVSSVFADDEYYLLEYYNREHDGQKPKGHYSTRSTSATALASPYARRRRLRCTGTPRA